MLENAMNMILGSETVTFATSGILHSYDSTHPYVTFTLPPEVSQYFAPMDCELPVPEEIEWPYMSVGTFAVDLILTLSADTMEVLGIDDIRVNPSLEGGF